MDLDVRDLLALTVLLVYRVTRDHKEALDCQVDKVIEAQADFKDLLEELALLVKQDGLEVLVFAASLVTLDRLVCQVTLVSQVFLETPVLLVLQVGLVLEAKLDHRVCQVRLDLPAAQVRVVCQVSKVEEESLERQALPVLLVTRDHVDLKDLPVSLDSQALRVSKAQSEHLEILSRELLEAWDRRDLLGLMDCQDLEER